MKRIAIIGAVIAALGAVARIITGRRSEDEDEA